MTQELQERLQQHVLEADAHASTIVNLKSGLEDKAQEITRLETAVRTLQHSKDQAIECAYSFPNYTPVTARHGTCWCLCLPC